MRILTMRLDPRRASTSTCIQSAAILCTKLKAIDIARDLCCKLAQLHVAASTRDKIY